MFRFFSICFVGKYTLNTSKEEVVLSDNISVEQSCWDETKLTQQRSEAPRISDGKRSHPNIRISDEQVDFGSRKRLMD